MKTGVGGHLQAPNPTLSDAVLTPAANPDVASLLDHIAEELAREYVRLMEAAATKGNFEVSQSGLGVE